MPDTLQNTDTTIRKSIFLAADKPTVWRYLTDADWMGRWFHPADETLAEGQDYMLRSQKDGDRMCWGKVEEMRPHDYMKWSFTVGPMDGHMTTVEWRLQDAPGGTKLSLKHSGLPQNLEGYGLVLALDKGWHGFLGNLHVQAALPQSADYRATITVPASPQAAHRAIFEEMNQWWSDRIEPRDGGVTVHFNNSHVSFDFAETEDGGHDWTCVDANMIIEDVADTTEWQGTHLLWRIEPDGSGSRITLTHQGLNPNLACQDVCVRGWQHYFESSLRAYLSGQEAAPQTH